MKKFMKPVTILPIIIGIIFGIVLFILGDMDDAPGLSLIGLVTAFLLIMWGIYNTGVIKKGSFLPILLLCFGTGGIIISIILLLDGEFEESPGIALIGVALGIILIIAGAIFCRKAKR